MRGGGATLRPSRNGGNQRAVEESQYFKLRCKLFEPYVSRLREIRRILKRQLAHDAEQNATEIGGEPGQWVQETKAGEGAPRLWFYYSLTATTCRLEYLASPDLEPPAPQDPSLL